MRFYLIRVRTRLENKLRSVTERLVDVRADVTKSTQFCEFLFSLTCMASPVLGNILDTFSKLVLLPSDVEDSSTWTSGLNAPSF